MSADVNVTEIIKSKLDEFVDAIAVSTLGVKPIVIRFADKVHKTSKTEQPVVNYIQTTISGTSVSLGFPPLIQTDTQVRVECDYGDHGDIKDASNRTYKFVSELLSLCRLERWSLLGQQLYLVSSFLSQPTFNVQSRVRYTSAATLNFRFYSRAS